MTWLAGWSYRKSDTITGSSVGIQTDYPVGVKVYYGSGVNGTEVIGGVTFGKVYMDSLCKTDFGDIRFAKLDATLLDYWIEEQVDSDYAIIWVEVDSIPANPGTVDIYIYYGNAGATTTSNGDDTFTFFDDFTQDRGWTIGNPTYIEIIDPEDVLWIDYRRNAANLYCYRSVSGLTDGFALWIDSWYDITTGSDDWSYGIFSLSVNNDGSRHSESEIYGIRGWGQAYGNKHGLIWWNGVGASGSQDGDADPNSDRFTYRISKHDTRLEYYCSSGNVPDGTAVVSAGIPAIAYMKGWTSSSQAGDVNDDCRKKIHVIRIGKWVYPEPAHTAWGDFGAVDLAAGFTVRQDSADLPAGFRVTQEALPAQFNVRQVASQDLAAQFIPIRIASPLEVPASFHTGGRGNVPARFRVTKYHNLEGTGGIAFYWWGAANPVEAMNQLILESPTGFWYTDFYDGPAAWRLVEIPWGSFTWVSAPQRRLEPHRYWPYPPDQSQIDAFIWTVHTHGLRRLDYVYAYPRVLPAQLIGYFDIRRTATPVELAAGFMVRQVASPELKANFIVAQGSVDLPAKFTAIPEGMENFDLYTEVDSAGDIVRDGSRVTWTSMRRDAVCYIYRDFGADFFGDFEFDFTCVTTDVEGGDTSYQGLMAPIAVANHLDPVSGLGDLAGEAALVAYIGENWSFDDIQDWNIWQHEDGGGALSDAGANRVIGTFYCTFGRKGTNCYLKVYSDAARTVLLDDLSFVGSVAYNYRYIMIAVSWSSGTDPADHSSGYVENLNIKRPSADLACGFDIA